MAHPTAALDLYAPAQKKCTRAAEYLNLHPGNIFLQFCRHPQIESWRKIIARSWQVESDNTKTASIRETLILTVACNDKWVKLISLPQRQL